MVVLMSIKIVIHGRQSAPDAIESIRRAIVKLPMNSRAVIVLHNARIEVARSMLVTLVPTDREGNRGEAIEHYPVGATDNISGGAIWKALRRARLLY